MPQTFNVGSRSLFVTVTAWVFMLLAVVVCATALVQSASLASLMPALGSHRLPFLTGLLVSYLPWTLAACVVLSAATLAAAMGLLLRLDWARRTFIGLLGLAVLFNLGGLWMQQELLQSVVDGSLNPAALPPHAAGVVSGFVTATRASAAVITLAACGLLGWIMRRLSAPAIRQEFA